MSSDNNVKRDESLLILEAQIDVLRGQDEMALLRLAGRTDPASIRRRIVILLNLKRFADATSEFRHLSISESWVDLGAYALAAIGDVATAREYLNWARAQKNPNLAHRCAALFVDGMRHWIFKDRLDDSLLVPGGISEREKQGLLDIVKGIEPLCEYTLARRSVETEVESQLLQRYFDVLLLLGDRKKASVVFDVLLTRTPIPIQLGQAVLQGLGTASKDIANRLWEEHPESFRAKVFSCIIFARQLDDAKTALERAFSLRKMAHSKDQKEELCEVIYEIWLEEGREAFIKVMEVMTELLGPGARLLEVFKADQLTIAGRSHEALAILEQSRDESDPRWLRGYANAKIHLGERAEALELLKKLGVAIPSPEVFRAIVRLSNEQGRIDDERLALEQTLVVEPENIVARRRLAMLLVNIKDYPEAARQFEILRELQPNDEAIITNLAVSYSFAGDLERALTVLVPTVGQSELAYGLTKTRAQILRAAGRLMEAFEQLSNAKTVHWNEAEYLIDYMDLAYSAGKEKEAHEAFGQLLELQQKGVVDEKLMRSVSLEDMRKWLEDAGKRHDEIRRYILQGKMTWLAAAEIQSEVPIWSWLLKTQPLPWIWDEPLNRATYAVYSTNAFRVFQEKASINTLEPISCPPKGTPIAVDLSALISMHELGVLDRVAAYFGTMYVPATYLERVMNDAHKLYPHQRSQKEAAQAIVAAQGRRQISVLMTAEGPDLELLPIDEYVDSKSEIGRRPLHLRDLFESMHAAGLLSDEQMARAKLIAHKPSVSLETQQPLHMGARVLIAGLTLSTIYQLGIIEVLTKEFTVYITKADYDEIVGRLRAFEALEAARAKYTDLWTSLRSDRRVRFVSTKAKLGEERERRKEWEVDLAGMSLARERSLPLFVDDRVSQAVILNELKGDKTAAFGMDAVLVKLLEAGELDAREAAKLLLKLIEWRYRFIVMSPEVMKTLADQYRSHPPGIAMRQVAKYVHDCMRDPGLFGGLESTTQPISIAVRLYQTWAQNISELVMDIWGDKEITESYAQEFTEWAMTELLPSPPRVLDDRAQAAIASLTPLTVLTRAMIRGGTSIEFQRINQGLRAIATCLEVDDAEYLSTVVRVAGAIDG